jgi:hypothetical protein
VVQGLSGGQPPLRVALQEALQQVLRRRAHVAQLRRLHVDALAEDRLPHLQHTLPVSHCILRYQSLDMRHALSPCCFRQGSLPQVG